MTLALAAAYSASSSLPLGVEVGELARAARVAGAAAPRSWQRMYCCICSFCFWAAATWRSPMPPPRTMR